MASLYTHRLVLQEDSSFIFTPLKLRPNHALQGTPLGVVVAF